VLVTWFLTGTFSTNRLYRATGVRNISSRAGDKTNTS